jgi:hypothetical protein
MAASEDASPVFVDIGDGMHEQHPVHSSSVGLVPKSPPKWDTLSIGLSIEVVVDANESPESCPPHTPHLLKAQLEVEVESVFPE